MKKILISIVAVIAAVATVQAGPAVVNNSKFVAPMHEAPGGAYVALYGGANFLHTGLPTGIDDKVGWNAGIKLGYEFAPCSTPGFIPALELDQMYQSFDLRAKVDQGGKVKTKTYGYHAMLNALAKYDCGNGVIPYGGFGLGWYYWNLKADGGASTSKNGFAWALIAGVDFALDANWAIFVEYKWLNFQIRKHKDFDTAARIGQQVVNLGARYRF